MKYQPSGNPIKTKPDITALLSARLVVFAGAETDARECVEFYTLK